MTTTNCSFVNLQETFLTQHSSGRKTTGSATKVFSESFADYKHYVISAVRQRGQTIVLEDERLEAWRNLLLDPWTLRTTEWKVVTTEYRHKLYIFLVSICCGGIAMLLQIHRAMETLMIVIW